LPASASLRLVGCTYLFDPDLDFGRAVSSAGDMDNDGFDELAVGVPGYPGTGTVMVFRGSAGGLLAATALTHSVPFSNGRLGRSLALGGDMDGDGYSDLIAGAPGDYPAATSNVIGHCVVYFGGPGALTTNSRSTVIGTGFSQVDDGFGFSVASVGDIDGDGYLELLVGAPGRRVGRSISGHATMFYGYSSGPTEIPVWEMDGEADEALGYSVATAGDGDGDGFPEWVVGAPDNQYIGRTAGRVLHVHYDIWASTYPVSVIYGEETARLGASLGSAGDIDGDGYGDLLIGGPSFDVYGSNQETGHAQLHRGGSATVASVPFWTESGGGSYGQSVASAGDINGDGFVDILAAAPDRTNGAGESDAGYFTIHLCNQNGPSYPADLTVEGGSTFGMRLGECVASAGDVNRDGYDDIIVGAPASGAIYQGRAFAWYGSATGITSATPNWTRNGLNPGDNLGTWVAGAGDVNGDGFADVLVSSPSADSGPLVDAGRVDLFLGSFSGLGATPQRTWFGVKSSQEFGWSAAGAGDVNGDGYDDVVIGSPYYDDIVLTRGGPDTLQAAGRADVYYGGINGPATIPSWSRFGDQDYSLLGYSVDGAGDLNGDGVSDFALGEMNYNYNGRVQVVFGSTSGVPDNTPLMIPSPLGGAQFGTTVSAAGDVDGDGYGDLAVTAPLGPGGFFHEGFVFVYRGAPGGLSADPPTQIDAGQIIAPRRMPVANAGDMDGDSFDDVLVGSPGTSTVQLYPGNGKFGQNRHFHQENAGGGNVAAHAALSTNQFRIGASVRTPWGRQKVRFQWELESVAVPFDGLGLVKGKTIALPAPVPGWGSSSEAVTGAIVAGPIGGPPAHWRARIISRSPFFPRSPWFSIGADLEDDYDVRPSHGVVAVEPPAVSNGRLALEGGRPNPFVSMTALRFTIARAGQVDLRILDVKGRLVRRIESGTLNAGAYTRSWDGLDMAGLSAPAGVYFAELASVEGRATTRLVRMR
jgi:hypothetical protein